MPPDHKTRAERCRKGCFNVILAALRLGRAIGGAGKIGILCGHQRPDQLRLALPQKCDDHQCKQDRRERQLQIDKAHDQRLDPAPDIGCKNAKGRADGQRDEACGKPDLDGNAQPVKDGREQIAPLRIGAEDMGVPARADETRWSAAVHERQVGQIIGVLRRYQ